MRVEGKVKNKQIRNSAGYSKIDLLKYNFAVLCVVFFLCVLWVNRVYCRNLQLLLYEKTENVHPGEILNEEFLTPLFQFFISLHLLIC
jgi:hypothetical protein